MPGSLDPVWAKIARAKAHSDELEKHILRTYRRKLNHPQIGIKADPQTREGILYISKMRDLSEINRQTALIAGDVIHNLRSALDHLVYQLAVEHTNDNIVDPNATQFPICDRRGRSPDKKGRGGSGFRREAKRHLGEVDLLHRARIESFQPYPRRKGRNFLYLRLLRDLDNRDKHRLLVPSIIAPASFTYPLTPMVALILRRVATRRRVIPSGGLPLSTSGLRINRVPIELGTELRRLMPFSPTHKGFKVKVIGSLMPTVTFGDGGPTIIATHRMIETVTHIVGSFEDAFE
jgi:hypothetical protein